MDVPELDDALLDKIVAQSDEQAGGRSIRQLEELRDDCLVAVMQGLRTHRFGAGAVLDDHERALFDASHPMLMADGDDLSSPLRLHTARVLPEWVDYNGHAHESRYLQVFGDASDAFLRYIGIDAAYLAAGGSYYTVETHLSFLREASAGEQLHVATQVLGFDDKRLHLFHELYRSGDDVLLAAGGADVPPCRHERRPCAPGATRDPRPDRQARGRSRSSPHPRARRTGDRRSEGAGLSRSQRPLRCRCPGGVAGP